MDQNDLFKNEVNARVERQGQDQAFIELSKSWLAESFLRKYSYNFQALGRPIIQYPQDMVAIQEIIWNVKPDLIIETGIAHGGSLIQSAMMLSVLDVCDAMESGQSLNPTASKRKVIGIDIDIREHNRREIETHPLKPYIEMYQGSSIDPEMVTKVRDVAAPFKNVMVFLDSNHTEEHVYEELLAYAPLTSKDNYCVVFDTLIEDLPDELFEDRPWEKGDNPKTAMYRFLEKNDNFEIDQSISDKLQISVARDGYLKRLA